MFKRTFMTNPETGSNPDARRALPARVDRGGDARPDSAQIEAQRILLEQEAAAREVSELSEKEKAEKFAAEVAQAKEDAEKTRKNEMRMAEMSSLVTYPIVGSTAYAAKKMKGLFDASKDMFNKLTFGIFKPGETSLFSRIDQGMKWIAKKGEVSVILDTEEKIFAEKEDAKKEREKAEKERKEEFEKKFYGKKEKKEDK